MIYLVLFGAGAAWLYCRYGHADWRDHRYDTWRETVRELPLGLVDLAALGCVLFPLSMLFGGQS
jgi:hypothetical protein